MSKPIIELSGACKLQIKTGRSGTMKMSIPKKNTKTGENNADGLINEVFKFAILRHGKARAFEMLEEKCALFGDEYATQGIQE